MADLCRRLEGDAERKPRDDAIEIGQGARRASALCSIVGQQGRQDDSGRADSRPVSEIKLPASSAAVQLEPCQFPFFVTTYNPNAN